MLVIPKTGMFETRVLEGDNIPHLAKPTGVPPIFVGLRGEPVSVFGGEGEERRRDAEPCPTPSPLLPPPSCPPPLRDASAVPRAQPCGSKPVDALGSAADEVSLEHLGSGATLPVTPPPMPLLPPGDEEGA